MVEILIKIAVVSAIFKLMMFIIKKMRINVFGRLKAQIKGFVGEMHVRKVLKKLKRKFRGSKIVNDVMYKNNQIDHLFLVNNLCFVIETKNYTGKVCCNVDDKDGELKYGLFGTKKKRILSPAYQNMVHTEVVKNGMLSLYNDKFEFINVVYFAFKNKKDYYIQDYRMNRSCYGLSSYRQFVKLIKTKIDKENKNKENVNNAYKKAKIYTHYGLKSKKQHIERINKKYCNA